VYRLLRRPKKFLKMDVNYGSKLHKQHHSWTHLFSQQQSGNPIPPLVELMVSGAQQMNLISKSRLRIIWNIKTR